MLNLLNQTAKASELPSTLQGFDFNPNIQLRSELASPFDAKITGYRAASYAGGFLSDYIPTTEEIQKVLQTLPADLPITVILSDGIGKTTATRHQLTASGEFKITHFDNVADAYAPQSSAEAKMFDSVTTFSEILGSLQVHFQGSAEAKMFDSVTPFSEILGSLQAHFQGSFEFLPQSVPSVAFTFGGSDLVETPMFDEVMPFSEILGTLQANFQGNFEFLPQSAPSVAFTFGSSDLVETPMFDEVMPFSEILGTLQANFQGNFEFLPQSVPAIEIIDPAKLTKVTASQIDAKQFFTLTNVQIELI